MANGGRGTLFRPPGVLGQQGLPWQLPVTYRRDPLSLVSGGATVGLGRSGLAPVVTQAPAPAGSAPWEAPEWFQNLPLGGIASPLARGVEAVATWPYRNLGAGVVEPPAQVPQLGAFAPGGQFAPGGAGFAGGPATPSGAYQGQPSLPQMAGGAAWPQGTVTAQVGAGRQQRGTEGRTQVAGGPQLRDPIDPRIDKAWYHAFQTEHEGQTPEEFYTGLPYEQLKFNRYDADMALSEALDDLEWSRGFQQMTGNIPTDDDWKAWWMRNYGRDMRTDRERQRDKEARKGGAGRKLPRFRDYSPPEEPEQRPPLWVPPVTYWR